MSFDIYGNNLRRGHCEVHPNVHEEFPCSLCLRERAAQNQVQREYGYCDGDPKRCENSHYLNQAQEHIRKLEPELQQARERIAELEKQIEKAGSEMADALFAKDTAEKMMLKFAEAARDVLPNKHYPRIGKRFEQLYPDFDNDLTRVMFPELLTTEGEEG